MRFPLSARVPAHRYLAILCACLLTLVLGVRLGAAQVGGGTGPMPRHFPHTASTPSPSSAGLGRIRLSVDDGDRGPMTLAPKNGGFVGEFVVWNDGQGPLTVSRVAMRSDDDDPRLPPRFTARFADGGGGSSVIQPHSSKRILVTWIPDRDPKLHQAVGHVVLTSNDEVAGEVAMGFVAPMTGPVAFLTAHLLTWLLFLPLAGALVAFAMHIVGSTDDDRLRGITVALTGLQCLLAIVLYQGFNGAVTRVDGNDGFQFVERAVLVHSLGIEYFVGVDGTNVTLVLLTAIAGFAGAVASYGVAAGAAPGGLRGYYGMYALLLAALMGVFVALDLALFLAFWATMLAALWGLVSLRGSHAPGPRAGARRNLAVAAGLSTGLLGASVYALYSHSDPSFLADGTRAAHTFALPELMRVAYNAKQLTILGHSWVKVVWVALFLAFAILAALVSVQSWFVDLLADAPTPVAAVVLGVVSKVGLYGILRVSFGVLPDGSRWAATTVVAFGVVMIAFGAVGAMRQTNLLRLVAYLAAGQAGFCLVGLGGMTREGIAGCLIQMVSHGVIMAMLGLLAGALRDRLGTTDFANGGGLAKEMPLYATAIGVALLASAGVPGFAGFWGEGLSLIGAFPTQRVLVAVAVVAATVAAGYQVDVVRRMFLAPAPTPVDPAADASATAVPRALHDLGARELAGLAPLFVLCLMLGFYPSPVLRLVQGGVSDLNQLVNPPGPDEVAMLDVSPPR